MLEGAVAFPVHVLERHEAQGRAVDAVAQASEFPGSVAEYVAEMGVASPAADFGAHHAMAQVGRLLQHFRRDGPGKGRPAASGLELVCRGKEGLARGDVHVDAPLPALPVGMAEGALGAGELGDGPGFAGEPCLELPVRGPGVAGRNQRVCPGRLSGQVAEALEGDVAVAAGMLLQVVLMIVFGGMERGQRFELDSDLPLHAGLHAGHDAGQHGPVCGVCVVHAGAVLGTDVVALAVDAQRVDDLEELDGEGFQADAGWIVDHAHGFGMAGFPRADILVGRMPGRAVGVAGLRVGNAGDAREVLLHAPEAAAGKVDLAQGRGPALPRRGIAGRSRRGAGRGTGQGARQGTGQEED